MCTCDGLSLTEVLVSLVIVTSASLALIQQQCHVTRYTHHLDQRNDALLQLDNLSEQMLSERSAKIEPSFQWTLLNPNTIALLELSWKTTGVEAYSDRLNRRLVRG